MPLKLSPTQIAFNARGDGRFNRPFQAQVDFFRSKLNLPTERYDDVLKAAHDRAFMVAGASKADLLNDLRISVDNAIANGESIGAFRKRFDDIVKKHGWEGWTGSDSRAGRDWRTRIIYQTNLSTSYAAGRFKQLNDPDLVAVRPYWKYIHNDTVAHPRPLHVSWSGMVLHKDDPWWKTHMPPNGWGCRCRVKAVRKSEFKNEKAPDNGSFKHIDAQGSTHTVPNGIDFGFDYQPGANTDTRLREFVQQKLIKHPPAISRALSRDVNRYINASEDIAGFASRAMTDRTNQETLWLGFVENADDIKALIDEDMTGHMVLLSSDAVRHIEKSRAFDGKNQRPVTDADFAGVMDGLLRHNEIAKSKPTKSGNKTFVITATENNERKRMVFEVLGKKQRAISLLSMVIRKK
ncbi:Phage Mu protein F like protein [Nitrosomonas aestuarii]|uniref:Phage Mu protein F like protein n=1 Tax=Nitrosomonas aestuarii TaxID=52441 RepID=A0A1I4DKI7_9PROT|nr:phage minor head protein [Nitrosomonas aestuarii]SFK92401.1 Phage Mu protein F like protein [Nitrosomonas aestuarii]